MADEKVIDLDRLTRYDKNLKTQANILQRDTNYSAGIYVYRGNIFLKCKTAGKTAKTSLNLSGVSVGDELTDGTVTWTVVDHFGGSGISPWKSNTQYGVGTIVVYSNGIYQCKTAHTSTTTFDDTKWTNLSIGYEKENLYTGTTFNTSTLTVTTSNSMLTKDFLIVKIAYSEDGSTVLMNKSFALVPVIGEVQDFSYQESTTYYIVVTGEITSATTFVFNFLEAYTIDNFKVVSIDGITLGTEDSLATSTQIQSLF